MSHCKIGRAALGGSPMSRKLTLAALLSFAASVALALLAPSAVLPARQDGPQAGKAPSPFAIPIWALLR
jgi:hypothetical protein